MALAGRRQAFISGLCSPGLDSAFFAVGEILRGPGSFLHPRLSSRLMQRKFSEPNTYIDGLPSRDCQEELYDDVEVSEPMMVSTWTRGGGASQTVRLSPRPAVPSHLRGHLLCMGLHVTHLTGDLSRKQHLVICSVRCWLWGMDSQ